MFLQWPRLGISTVEYLHCLTAQIICSSHRHDPEDWRITLCSLRVGHSTYSSIGGSWSLKALPQLLLSSPREHVLVHQDLGPPSPRNVILDSTDHLACWLGSSSFLSSFLGELGHELTLVFVSFGCLRVLSAAFQRTSGACYCTTTLSEIQAGEAGELCVIDIRSPMDIDFTSSFVIFSLLRPRLSSRILQKKKNWNSTTSDLETHDK